MRSFTSLTTSSEDWSENAPRTAQIGSQGPSGECQSVRRRISDMRPGHDCAAGEPDHVWSIDSVPESRRWVAHFAQPKLADLHCTAGREDVVVIVLWWSPLCGGCFGTVQVLGSGLTHLTG